MSEPAKKPGLAPESYSPKDMPEIMKLAQAVAGKNELPSDSIADPFAGGEPPRTSNRITEYRRIQNWENYFLASAIYSVAKLAGFDEDALTMFAEKNGNKGMHFFSAITGDMFTPMYDTLDEMPADSGYTACFFAPQVIKRAFAAFGRDCVYLSPAYIKENLRTVTNAVKASIDKGIPVLSWGWGNVTSLSGWHGDMPEGCLVGGYEHDELYVQLYPGPERMAVDDNGYSTSTDGLLGSKGLFFVGDHIEKTPLPDLYREAIAAIPSLLTQPPAEGILFGKAAFDLWADNLLDETNFTGKTEEELGGLIWSLHCKSFCNVCTSNADHFIRAAAPEVEIAAKLLPLYERFFKCKDKIWKLSGGFYPPAKKFRKRKFRMKIAELLREMGSICDEIVESYKPCDIPEIIGMARQAQELTGKDSASKAASSSGGGSRMIPNVPVFYYDGTNAGFFNTLLQAALQSLGEEHDRAKLTALSGEGNRFCWMDGVWRGGCEGSGAISETPYETENRTLDAIGWKAKYITVERDSSGRCMNTGPAQIRRDFVGSIDKGFPVIARLVKHPESNINLFFGYEDDGKKIVFYDYVKDFEPGVSKHEEYEAVAVDNWEDNIAGYILLQEKEEAASERSAALSAFKWISGHARRTTPINGKLVGFAAWESYLRMIEHDNFAKLSSREVRARLGIYFDAMGQINERKAALPYYRSLSEQFPAWREELDAAVAALEACGDSLGSMWAEEFNYDKKKAIKKFRDPAARKGFAAAGRECMRKDMEAVSHFEAILRKEGTESYKPREVPEIVGVARQAQIQFTEETATQQPEIITRGFLLAGFEAAIELNDEHWPGMDYVKAALKENLHRLGNLSQPQRFFDVWEADPKVNYKKKKNHSRRLFFFGAAVTSLEGVPEGFVTKNFPETTFALFREREHSHAKFEWLAAAGYKLDGAYAEKYTMDMEIYGDIEDEGEEWDALIPIVKPESYSPKEMPEIMKMAEEQAQQKYQKYKGIEYYLERVSFPETLKIAGVPWQEGFGNIGEYHANYRDKLSCKHEPYADAEISFFAKKRGSYLFGCRVTSIDDLPEGMVGIDTGYRDFEVLTFRAPDFHTLVGGADGPGEAMTAASEYTKEVWLPAHRHEVELHNANEMSFKMKLGRRTFGCNAIGVYRNTSDENPEMCHFIPLKANRGPGRLNKNKKRKSWWKR